MRVQVGVAVVVLTLGGCSGGGDERGQASATPSDGQTAVRPTPVQRDRALRAELLGMERRDQRQRTGGTGSTGGTGAETDQDRTDRLAEIIDVHGWPTYDLVGRAGADAAWVIAQHSDLDPDFQSRALELLRDAVERGQGSPGNLAYLEDRVAVAAGEPQTYGTQVACTPDGPEPATPIRDEEGLDERRAEAGLGPFRAYVEEMTTICTADLP